MEEQLQNVGESQSIPEINLNVGTIIGSAFSIGFKYFFPLLGCFILWIITIWIPYLNIGTTIALYGIVVKMAKNESFGIGEIFRPEYRQIFPEFFLLLGLSAVGIYFSAIFFIIPALVLSIAWLLSYFLLIDKKMGVIEALKESNRLTNGYKWDIFGGFVILTLIFVILIILDFFIFKEAPDEFEVMMYSSPEYTMSWIGWVIFFILIIILSICYYGAYAHIYRELTKRQ